MGTNKNLQDVIRYKRITEGYSTGQISACIGTKEATWFRRMREPEQFRLEELQELSKRLKMKITIDNGKTTAECEL